MTLQTVLARRHQAMIAVTMVLGPALSSVAAVIEVAPNGNIQSAIDLAVDGDIIQLSAGTYRPGSRLLVDGKSLELRGHLDEDGAPTTIIDGMLLDRHLQVFGSPSSELAVHGIEFRFGGTNQDRAGSIHLLEGELSLTSCRFRQNVVPIRNWGKGGAIYCESGTRLNGTGVHFLYNGKCCEQAMSGGAICGTEATIELTDCDFEGNYGSSGGAIYTQDSSVAIDHCRFVANGIRMPNSAGGGALLFLRSEVAISDSDFIGNVGEFGGALCFWDLNQATVTRCRFLQNGSDDCHWCRGGAVCLNNGSSTLHLEACEFAGNIASSQDIYALNFGEAADSFVHLKDCRFEDCCSIDSPRAIVDLGGNQIAYNCDGCAGDIDCRQPWPDAPKATDASDLGLLLERWGTEHPAFDIDGDGTVGAGDLGILLGSWGPCSD